MAFVVIASLLVFCFVWYKTKDWPSDKERKEKPIEGELSEPYKTYVEFDNYISEIGWVKIVNEDEIKNHGRFLDPPSFIDKILYIRESKVL